MKREVLSWPERLTVQAAQIDKYLRGDRWRPLVRWIYTVMAPFYDPAGHRLLPNYWQAGRELLATLQVQRKDRLLDLGCGTGLVTLAATQGAGTVVGLDVTRRMLLVLRQRAATRRERPLLIQADARFLPLRDASFTGVTTSFMLLHLTTAEQQQVLREVRRVLVPGGRFGCLTSLNRLATIYPTGDEWRAWLLTAGFEEPSIPDLDGVFRLVLAQVPERGAQAT